MYGYLCFVLVNGYSGSCLVCAGVTYGIIYYYYYIILYFSHLLFTSFPSHSQLLLFLYLSPSQSQIISSSVLLNHTIYKRNTSIKGKRIHLSNVKENQSIFHPHSFYTCRSLVLLTYISSRFSCCSPKLTPHVLSEWMVEVCGPYLCGYPVRVVLVF